MASGTAASRVTGQIRTILLAWALGTTGYAANAYQAGSMIPQVIYTLVSGGIFNAVLVPQIVRTLKAKDAETRLNDTADAPQPAIDRAVIEQFRELDPDGSMALAARILGIYADSSGSVFADIEQSMANGDSELLRRAAHSLKSSSANVGARQLSVLLKEFELLGKENRVDEARAQFDALRAEYARAHEGIRALRLEFAP